MIQCFESSARCDSRTNRDALADWQLLLRARFAEAQREVAAEREADDTQIAADHGGNRFERPADFVEAPGMKHLGIQVVRMAVIAQVQAGDLPAGIK